MEIYDGFHYQPPPEFQRKNAAIIKPLYNTIQRVFGDNAPVCLGGSGNHHKGEHVGVSQLLPDPYQRDLKGLLWEKQCIQSAQALAQVMTWVYAYSLRVPCVFGDNHVHKSEGWHDNRPLIGLARLAIGPLWRGPQFQVPACAYNGNSRDDACPNSMSTGWANTHPFPETDTCRTPCCVCSNLNMLVPIPIC